MGGRARLRGGAPAAGLWPTGEGNFARCARPDGGGGVLPLAAVDNRRSLVRQDTLVGLLALCVTHPPAAGQAFLVADGEDLSTPELIRRIAQAMGRSARLRPVPPKVLRLAARLRGGSARHSPGLRS